MKKLLFILLFLPLIIFAQDYNQKKTYLDSLWRKTTEGNHKYYRIIESYDSQTKLYSIKDYYKSGILKMEGNSKTEDFSSYEGEFVSYYENGNKKDIVNYGKSNKPIGKTEQWHENGTKKSEGEYIESEKGIFNTLKIYQYWNPDGKQTVTDGNGYFEETDKDHSDSGNIKNGLKEGTWKGKFNKNCRYTETYKEGKIVTGVSTDENNKEYQYDEFESKPEPKGGIQNFYKYIGKNFKIYKEDENIKGTIITSFIVDKDGQITEPITIKSIKDTLDYEAIDVISSYKKWIPGKQRGQYVRVKYQIPITLAGLK
ncbi:energy transducer TonB [Flavobacterium aquicola]|uniref:TonB-like protein n=1 Tax=Flavobacterium aquicola TaxID=1682742 RepID=A0A3E0EQB0_9FLAO|nr:energy transducer TonB [Flavobacterium aquicola]REH00435.1 TonB-like protein [Flavobacterium aquicola]